ncbi:MAG: hypothetical protein J0L70_11115 [Leptolyngbya sp. UWPOB_LEPTO1]|uniref:hypothetical protein n=1 Tax=Leptolyngbya sp. UWPOB_LEPTO1 TaxID=2815653 RepID=UPI001AC8224B|nr:hypothetical protein [Leptolyngbya sp. UWPOB_LEPTO1]MBN8561066.1 hypothetical protein [Leptolyngbya sp. UWPOB_LEPTO1]
MDEVVRKIAALGLPGVVLLVTMASTGLAGAAAITAALAALGPAGMLGGVAFLGVVGIAGDALSKFGLEAILSGVYLERRRQGASITSLHREIDQLWVSNDLKRLLREVVSR